MGESGGDTVLMGMEVVEVDGEILWQHCMMVQLGDEERNVLFNNALNAVIYGYSVIR